MPERTKNRFLKGFFKIIFGVFDQFSPFFRELKGEKVIIGTKLHIDMIGSHVNYLLHLVLDGQFAKIKPKRSGIFDSARHTLAVRVAHSCPGPAAASIVGLVGKLVVSGEQK